MDEDPMAKWFEAFQIFSRFFLPIAFLVSQTVKHLYSLGILDISEWRS
jgi:hypothetical protein